MDAVLDSGLVETSIDDPSVVFISAVLEVV